MVLVGARARGRASQRVPVVKMVKVAARNRALDQGKDAGLAGITPIRAVVTVVLPVGQERDKGMAGARVMGKAVTVVLVARIPQAAARARLMDKVKDAGLAGMAATEVVVAEDPPMGQDRDADMAGARVTDKAATVVLVARIQQAAARARLMDKVKDAGLAGMAATEVVVAEDPPMSQDRDAAMGKVEAMGKVKAMVKAMDKVKEVGWGGKAAHHCGTGTSFSKVRQKGLRLCQSAAPFVLRVNDYLLGKVPPQKKLNSKMHSFFRRLHID